MQTFISRSIWASVFAAGAFLGGGQEVKAQFGPGNYNPYHPTLGGGSYVPGVSNRYSFPIQPRGPTSVVIPLGGNTYAQFPFFGGVPQILAMSSAGNNNNAQALYPAAWPRGAPYPTSLVYSQSIGNATTTSSGYRTGGASAGPTQSRSVDTSSSSIGNNDAPGIELVDRPAARVEQGRNAFNRWANQRDRQQGKPDPNLAKQVDLQRNLAQPELKDVISGESLNVILDALMAMPDRVKKTTPIAMDETTMKRLNFTRGTGSIGLLNDEGRVAWPASLQSFEAIAALRPEIETRFAELYKQVAEGQQVNAAAIDMLIAQVDRVTDQVTANGKAFTFAENVTVKRFLGSLEDSIRFLKQPDAVEWLPGHCKLKPATIQDLIQVMSDKKIRFAPALVGNDQVNISTHLMLARVYRQAMMNR